MEYRELLTVALDFATAILLGALVGIEREKRRRKAYHREDKNLAPPLECLHCNPF